MPVDNQDALTEELEIALTEEVKDDSEVVETPEAATEEVEEKGAAAMEVEDEEEEEVDGLGVDAVPMGDDEDEEEEAPAADEEEEAPVAVDEEEEEEPEDLEEKNDEEEIVEEKTDEVADETEVETEEKTDDEAEESEVKGGRRVIVDTEEKADTTLEDRRSELLAELAELNAQISPEKGEVDDETKARTRARLEAIGYKAEEIDAMGDDPMLCAVEQKVLDTHEPCAFCRGGCANEGKSAPGLLQIEALAMEEYKGTILGSAYSPANDMFVVDVKTEDDRTIEVFYSGQGQAAGWVLLDQEMAARMETEGKDALAGTYIISMNEAEEIALKSLEGVSVGVDADVFEGFDAWNVQIEGIDGKSYDAFVGLDGKLLGYDEYEVASGYNDLTPEEIEEVKAIEGELHFKREFNTARREELAKEGAAMSDGSYPIVNETDLKNAIQAIGRAKDPELTKAHIMKRAVQLGKEDLIPDDWKGLEEDVEVKADDASFLKDLADFQVITLGLDD